MKIAFVICWTLLSLTVYGQGSVHVMRTEPAPEPAPQQQPAEAAPQAAPQQPSDNYQQHEGGGSIQVHRTQPEASPAEVGDEGAIDVQDDQDIAEIEAAREARSKHFEQINEAVPDVFDPVAELKKLGHEKIDLDTLMDAKVIPVFERMFKESNLKGVPRDQHKTMIQQKFQGQPLGKVFAKCPKCLEIFVDVVRDEKAMPSLLQIFKRKPDLKKFGMIWIACLIVMWLLKRKLFPKEWPFYKRIPASLMFSLMFTGLSFIIFYSMFKTETQPTIAIIMGHL